MKSLFFISLSLFTILMFGQDDVLNPNQVIVDSLYREDQIYVGITFNLLSNKPTDFDQSGFSAGIQAGFVRDMPINKRRNKAIGVGVGIAVDTYNQNLLITEASTGDIQYEILQDEFGEDVNRFTSYTLEFPVEYRWRTSTPEDYSFWRIHAGVKLGYLFSLQSTFENDDEEVFINDISDINRLQYGPTFSFGYGAFNFQAYYGMSALFNDDAQIEGENISLQVLRLGLVFYFL